MDRRNLVVVDNGRAVWGKVDRTRLPGTAKLSLLAGLALAAAVGPALADSKMDAAKAFIAEHKAAPLFVNPGPAFDAKKCAEGKKMVSLPLSTTIPYSMATNKGMAAAAAKVGLGYSTWENQLKVDQWIAGINNAIGQKDALINLWSGINPDVLRPQIAEAQKAEIKVVSTDTYDITQTPSSAIDNAARSNHSLAAKLLANWAYVRTDGKPNVVIVGSDEVTSTKPMVTAIRETLKELCPECKTQYLNVPAPEWGTKIQPGVQAMLVADPGINFVLPIYDSMSQFVIPALRLTNRVDSVKIAGADGTPFVIDLVRTGQVDMDVGSSVGWIGYAGLDAALRVICGLAPVHDLNTPFVVFDKTNAEMAGVPATYDKGYGDAYVTGFEKLWGVH
jgi:ribose transport system substrate-binding protein